MILAAMEFSNFRIFRQERIGFDSRITAIVGPNDSGKTTVLDALNRALRLSEFEWSQVDRCRFAEEEPRVDLLVKLDEREGDKFLADLQLERKTPPTELRVRIEADGVHIALDGKPALHGKPLGDDRARQLELALPTPILLGTGLRPIPSAFELDEANPDPRLLDLLALAELEIGDLSAIRDNDPEVRQMLLGCAKNLTSLLNRYWSQDSQLELDLRSGDRRLECLVGEQGPGGKKLWGEAATRGDGLRWFITFLIKLHPFIGTTPSTPFIFLFDEPAANLHPAAQKDVRRVLNSLAERWQVVYATHSPFMLDWSQPYQIRLVQRNDSESYGPGATIQNKPYHGDTSIGLWEPFRSNLGLFLGDLGLLDEQNLLVEGPSDQLLVNAISRQLGTPGAISPSTEPWSIIACGDDAALDAIVDLAHRHSRSSTVLLDGDQQGRKAKSRLLKKGRCSAAFHTGDLLPIGIDRLSTDIEDLFDRSWYLQIVNKRYSEFEWFAGIQESDLDLSVHGLGAALKEAFKSRGWSEFSKMDIARRIAEKEFEVDGATIASWKALFARIKSPSGLIWLGANTTLDRGFLHLVEATTEPVQSVLVEIRDAAGGMLAQWTALESQDLEFIDTCKWAVISDLKGLVAYRRIDCKISFPISPVLRGASAALVLLQTQAGDVAHSVEISLDELIPSPIPKGVRAKDPYSRFLEKYGFGSTVVGRVSDTGPYGFKVDLSGIEPGVEGFNHISEITGGWIPSVDQFVSIGEEVEVRVIEPYRLSGRKFDLSLRQAMGLSGHST